jgi:hypothetical protein
MPPVKRSPGIPLDGKSLATIAELLTPYVAREGLRLSDSYRWKIPDGAPVASLNTSGLSLADANVRLKRSLSEAWHLSGSDRTALARWYVGRWGGIYANKNATLQSYVLLPEAELEQAPLSGVATWSKILAMRNPARYAIFDARVSAALNALQIGAGVDPILFPDLLSRNTAVRLFQGWVRTEHGGARRVLKERAYPDYMALLHEVGGRLGHDSPDQAEMVLFANAESLVHQAMGKARPY